MGQTFCNSDWELFYSRLPSWQEAYMDKLNQAYIALLSGDGPPSEKFWALNQRIREDRKSPGVQLERRRSTMMESLIALIRYEAITLDDLDGFSEELTEKVRTIITRD